MPTYSETFLEKIEVQQPLLADVPLIVDDWSLAFRLGFTGKTTWYIIQNRQKMYMQFMVKKKTGGLRRTFDPNGLIRLFQSQMRARILYPLVSRLGPHVAAYQVGKSTLDAAAVHLRPCAICDETTKPNTQNVKHECPRQGVKFKMDLKDFFLSTRRSWIRQYFNEVVGYNHYASSLLAQLLTTDYRDSSGKTRTGVPPGALTAGDICNLVADWKLDQPILKMLPAGWKYTRYADDLYLSCDKKLNAQGVNAVVRKIENIIVDSGYRVNWDKLSVQHWSRPQRILGININRKMNIPSGEYNKLYHTLYFAKKKGFEAQLPFTKKESVEKQHAWIVGKLNYFFRFAPEKTKKLQTLYEEAKAAHKEADGFNLFDFSTDSIPPSPPTLAEENDL